MTFFRLAIRFTPLLLVIVFLTAATNIWAGVPVPSQWQGEITGQAHNRQFRLPVVIEFKQPLPYENNPVNIFMGAGNPNDIGHVYLSSAMRYTTSRGPATLQYLTISVQGSRIQAKLTNHHGAAAAKANGFSGPNVSSEQASNLMKDIFRDAWGATEMFGFGVGATLVINVSGNQLSGAIQGAGTSYTGSSPAVHYRANLAARRVQ